MWWYVNGISERIFEVSPTSCNACIDIYKFISQSISLLVTSYGFPNLLRIVNDVFFNAFRNLFSAGK